LHLFYECAHVSAIVDATFNRITARENFEYSRREYFTTFERREFSHAKNLVLTIISKFIMKFLWDCKLRFTVPTVELCWEYIHETVSVLRVNNKKFFTLWNTSGLTL
jgi:hypothetical protein